MSFEHGLHPFPMELDKGEILALRRASGVLETESNIYASEIANVLPAKPTLWCTYFCTTDLSSQTQRRGETSGVLSGSVWLPWIPVKRKTHDLPLSRKTVCLTDSHFNAQFCVLAYKNIIWSLQETNKAWLWGMLIQVHLIPKFMLPPLYFSFRY